MSRFLHLHACGGLRGAGQGGCNARSTRLRIPLHPAASRCGASSFQCGCRQREAVACAAGFLAAALPCCSSKERGVFLSGGRNYYIGREIFSSQERAAFLLRERSRKRRVRYFSSAVQIIFVSLQPMHHHGSRFSTHTIPMLPVALVSLATCRPLFITKGLRRLALLCTKVCSLCW